MKRRNFLIGGIGALATGTTGCAGVGIRQVIAPSSPNVKPAEMDGFLVALDGAMNRITENPAGERIFSASFNSDLPASKMHGFFVRGCARSCSSGISAICR